MRSLKDPFKWLNPYYITVDMKYQCSDEKLKTFWQAKKEATNKSIISGYKEGLLFVFPKTKGKVSLTINLNEFKRLLPDFIGCAPENVTAYSDLLYSSIVEKSSPVSLASNPTLKDDRTGELSLSI